MVSLLLVLAGLPVQFCVGTAHGNVSACADTFSGLPTEVDGQLFALDKVGNSADWGPFCSWRGVRVQAVGTKLDVLACDEAKRRLDEAAAALTRAELVQRDEWPRAIASSLRGVLLYPVRVLDVPSGEPLVEGVYVPEIGVVHLTATLEAAPHELFHAVLQSRGADVGHASFNPRVDFVQRAFAARHRRPIL